MRILHKSVLLTNDDGIESPGLLALYRELKKSSKYEIFVVAPKTAQSAKGASHAHGDQWINYEKNDFGIMVDASPATSVSIALKELNIIPDIVVSGINFGENIGQNIFYSGTVGAGWEAAMSGYLALASSLELPSTLHYKLDPSVNFDIAVHFTIKVLKKLLDEQPMCRLWNMNVPNYATEKTEIVETSLATERWNSPVIKERKTFDTKPNVRFEFEPTNKQFTKNSDVSLLRAGKVVLTPINSIILPWYEKGKKIG